MMNRTGERKSRSDARRTRAALGDAAPGLIGLVATETIVSLINPSGGARAWHLLTLVPALWLVRAQVRALHRSDELERTHQLEAMAVGFGAMVVLSLLGGLLDAAHLGSARQSLQVTFIAGVLVWVLALFVKTQPDR